MPLPERLTTVRRCFFGPVAPSIDASALVHHPFGAVCQWRVIRDDRASSAIIAGSVVARLRFCGIRAYDDSMRIVRAEGAGGPEQLIVTNHPELDPKPGHILIEVAAAGVNRADVLQRRGQYPSPAGDPGWPGLEVSGTVAALGVGVTTWALGDRVCALLGGGGYAEQVGVDHRLVLPVPDRVDLVSAAGLPEVTCTVWSNLGVVAGLRAGELVLIHGGSSGIGTTAIQIAIALGARVAVTASSQAKLDACERLGAQVLINYREQDFVQVMDDAGGADVILDVVGAKYLSRNLAALAPDGRIVTIGLQGGARAELDLAGLLAKRGTISATSLRGRPIEQRAAIVAQVREQVWPLIDDGSYRVLVDSTFPLERAADAHRLMESGGHIGKILLTTGRERLSR